MFVPKRRKKTLIGLVAFGILYLIVHALVFDRSINYGSLKVFISESKEHVWHVLPLLLIFMAFFAKDGYDRVLKRGPYAPPQRPPTT